MGLYKIASSIKNFEIEKKISDTYKIEISYITFKPIILYEMWSRGI